MLTEAEANEACRLLEHNELHFQRKEHRDQVWALLLPEHKLLMRRRSIANQIVDPRYTWEGRALPDKGLANDSWYGTLYSIEVKP
jgi:hypothetical protein